MSADYCNCPCHNPDDRLCLECCDGGAYVQEFAAAARKLLIIAHNADYDGHGYGLLDEDRAAIKKLLGPEPELIDARDKK